MRGEKVRSEDSFLYTFLWVYSLLYVSTMLHRTCTVMYSMMMYSMMMPI